MKDTCSGAKRKGVYNRYATAAAMPAAAAIPAEPAPLATAGNVVAETAPAAGAGATGVGTHWPGQLVMVMVVGAVTVNVLLATQNVVGSGQ